MTFTAIVCSHANQDGLRKMLANLATQTRPPDETLVYASGVDLALFASLAADHPHAVFHLEDDRRDWGHAKRAAGVRRAKSDYLGFFNDDDSYESDYIESMLHGSLAGADVVYCGWNTYPQCEFRLGSSTSGNFIVDTDLAVDVGYPEDAVYENDGHFIDELARRANTIVYVPRVLYRHNVQ